MKKWSKICFSLLLILLLYKIGSATQITILFTNSTNGILKACPTCPNLLYGGLARRATLINEYRSKYKSMLLLDAGDLFPVVAPKEQAEYVLKAMNLMGYDAMAIGDQEFNYGKEFLQQVMQRASFPFISATIVYKEPDRGTHESGSGNYNTRLFTKPYIIKEVAGLKILITGVISERAFIFFPKDKIEGLTILEPVPALKEILFELKPRVDLVILLSHLGETSDEKLAQQIEGIDLIVGGHDQVLIEKPVRIGRTIIVQAGKNGEHLGEITLKINTKEDSPVFDAGRVNSATTIINYKLTLLTDKIPDDQQVARLVEEFYQAQEAQRLAHLSVDTVALQTARKRVPFVILLTPVWNLGIIEKGRIYEDEIQLRNIGSDTLTIKKVRSSCDCLVASLIKDILPPEEKTSIKLKLFADEVQGETFVYNLYIESNDPNQPVSMVLVRGAISSAEGPKEESPKLTRGIPLSKKSGQHPLPVMFFYSPGCHYCEEIKNKFLPEIRKKYAGKVEIKEYDISKKENYEVLVRLEEKYGVKQSAPMEIFVGDQYLLGRKEIKEKLESIILNATSRLSQIARQKQSLMNQVTTQVDTKGKIVERFKSFGLLAIIIAGLIDGINPCAFATIIFFISFLTYAGRNKNDILLNGIFFAAGVFIAYFLIGVGLFKIIYSLSVFHAVSRIIFYAILALTLSLGCLSIYDAYIFKKTGETKKVKLQLPHSIKENIHFWIKKNINTSFIIMGALTTGLIVSILEAVCTGQIYLPTITFMTKEPSLAGKAYFYLFLYNLMFIVPLVIVFLLAYSGIGSQRLGQFSQKHLVFTKVLTAVFFFGLAILLVILR